jgi:hypothetical protein
LIRKDLLAHDVIGGPNRGFTHNVEVKEGEITAEKLNKMFFAKDIWA